MDLPVHDGEPFFEEETNGAASVAAGILPNADRSSRSLHLRELVGCTTIRFGYNEHL